MGKRGKGKSKGKSKGKKRKHGGEKEVKMVFWNVAGIKKKDKEFWQYIETFDIVGLTATRIEQKEWERVKGKLLRGLRWEIRWEH